MSDPKDLFQESFVTKDDNPDPEYHRLLAAYTENPFYDMTVRPDEKKKEEADATPSP